jgi:hypothetical protein
VFRLLDAPHSNSELYDGHREDMDLIAAATVKMKQAREYWVGKIEQLKGLFTDLSRSKEEQSSPFHLLLRLFTYENVLGELDQVFEADPASIEFYIPQLVTFLLHSAYWSAGSLQDFLLDKCSRSVTFAHRLFWFLNASCLYGSGINSEGVQLVTALIQEVKERGQESARRLNEGRTPEEQGGAERPERDNLSASGQPKDDDFVLTTTIDVAKLSGWVSLRLWQP